MLIYTHHSIVYKKSEPSWSMFVWAALTHVHSREVYERVLSDHDLLDQLAVANLHQLRVVKGRGDLTALATQTSRINTSTRPLRQTVRYTYLNTYSTFSPFYLPFVSFSYSGERGFLKGASERDFN